MRYGGYRYDGRQGADTLAKVLSARQGAWWHRGTVTIGPSVRAAAVAWGGLPPPAPAELRFLAEHADAEAGGALVLRLLPRGVARLAVRLVVPTRRAGVAALAAGAVAERHDRDLAAIEGALGVSGPAWVGFARGPDGPDVELGYRPVRR